MTVKEKLAPEFSRNFIEFPLPLASSGSCFFAHKKTPTRYRVGVILLFLVNPAGLEPATVCLEGRCSIQLSYESKPIG